MTPLQVSPAERPIRSSTPVGDVEPASLSSLIISNPNRTAANMSYTSPPSLDACCGNFVPYEHYNFGGGGASVYSDPIKTSPAYVNKPIVNGWIYLPSHEETDVGSFYKYSAWKESVNNQGGTIVDAAAVKVQPGGSDVAASKQILDTALATHRNTVCHPIPRALWITDEESKSSKDGSIFVGWQENTGGPRNGDYCPTRGPIYSLEQDRVRHAIQNDLLRAPQDLSVEQNFGYINPDPGQFGRDLRYELDLTARSFQPSKEFLELHTDSIDGTSTPLRAFLRRRPEVASSADGSEKQEGARDVLTLTFAGATKTGSGSPDLELVRWTSKRGTVFDESSHPCYADGSRLSPMEAEMMRTLLAQTALKSELEVFDARRSEFTEMDDGSTAVQQEITPGCVRGVSGAGRPPGVSCEAPDTASGQDQAGETSTSRVDKTKRGRWRLWTHGSRASR